MSTPDKDTRTMSRHVRAMPLMLMMACAPGEITRDGSGETGETGGGAAPDVDAMCVEMVPGSVTCWVDWLAGVDARVLLECQTAEAVTAGAWGPGYGLEVPAWGLVLCHDILGTDGAVCLFDDDRVLLTETVDGWVPELSVLVGQYEPTAPPCT